MKTTIKLLCCMFLVMSLTLTGCPQSKEKEPATPNATTDTPADETPTDETPTDVTPTDETPTDVTPTDETPTDVTPTDETPTDVTPTDETPTDVTPIDETPTDVTPTDEAPADVTPSDETKIIDPGFSYIDLGAENENPDGMTNDPTDNSIVLVIPQCLEDGPAKVLKIMPDDSVVEWFELPAHPETNKATPLGIAFGPDGNLYVADSQDIGGNPEHKGRLMRIVVEDGKPVRAEVLATNFCCPNGLAVNGNKVYFCETKVVPTPEVGMVSGVFCFDIDQLDPANPYVAKPYVSADDKDPHFIFEFTTEDPEWLVGANGLGFSPDGKTMYVCNFGNDAIVGVQLADDGTTVESSKIVAQGQGMQSVDGLKVDPKTGMIYVADFAGNAVWQADPATGKVTCIMQNPVGTGEGGLLDRCSEVCLRDGKLYVSNIDLPYGNETEAPSTITIIDLANPPGPVMMETETPPVEAPAEETPVIEAPAVEIPVIEIPPTESPEANPIIVTPPTEGEAPVIEIPATEAPQELKFRLTPLLLKLRRFCLLRFPHRRY